MARPVAAVFGIACRVERGVALTFDDGPHPQGTPAVLRQLERAGVRGTFFLVGEQVVRYPSLAAEIAAAGHELGLHGHRHTLLLRRRPVALRDDLLRVQSAVHDATGVAATLYRPPYGVFSLSALLLVRRLGCAALLWSRWGRDWERRATADSIASRATRHLRDGDVVLLHDADHYSSPGSWTNTAAALPAIVDAAAAVGARLVTPSEAR